VVIPGPVSGNGAEIPDPEPEPNGGGIPEPEPDPNGGDDVPSVPRPEEPSGAVIPEAPAVGESGIPVPVAE
jgi:hypothetical protein